MLRRSYVRTVHGARRVAERTNLLARLDSSPSFWGRHARTLFAIHDIDELIGLDLPWWTYRAIDRVEGFLAGREGKARVFEYGSGASTHWLAKRAGEVISVEHDQEFAGIVRSRVGDLPNVTLLEVPARQASGSPEMPSGRHGHEGLDFADYVCSIDQFPGLFDLIVVDGRAREACLRQSAPRLDRDGLLLFDDCTRRRYRADLRSSGLRVEEMRGARPCVPYLSSTAILSHDAGQAEPTG